MFSYFLLYPDIFHNLKNTTFLFQICFLLFAVLYIVSYFIITRYKRKAGKHEVVNIFNVCFIFWVNRWFLSSLLPREQQKNLPGSLMKCVSLTAVSCHPVLICWYKLLSYPLSAPFVSKPWVLHPFCCASSSTSWSLQCALKATDL